jgi:hypothetical protein
MMLMAVGIGLLAWAPGATAGQPVRASFAYILSDFTGPIPINWLRVTADVKRNEVYTLYQNSLNVFNASGMEIYRFGDDLDVGQILDVAVDEPGDILLLTHKAGRVGIVRCNYRGEPTGAVELRLPAALAGFAPDRMLYQGGRFYLASSVGMTVVVADRGGTVLRVHDLFGLLGLDERDRGNAEIGGFAVDRDENLLVTIPVLFRVSVISRDGKVASFGKPGGAPGSFNHAAGIARDSRGNYLVVDRLKCAVLVFDPTFRFVTQFGSRGSRAGDLVFPVGIAIDAADRVYITQVGKRGVSVFALAYN